ncbi:hypothetical protein RQ734_20130 [Roseomonas mucosa]|uniref:hypothetical protein n=1 Tax=Roseomonas mucosa TaxID=207340 RepID=UPI0028CF6414|nr:hypothetical protein [Roseomonas mucosa]MDT8278375.1 hypothetical protein [Roseomonas mucosa]
MSAKATPLRQDLTADEQFSLEIVIQSGYQVISGFPVNADRWQRFQRRGCF